MPIFSPEEEERDDLLNSISIFFSPRRQTNWCVSLKLIFHPFIYCSDFLSQAVLISQQSLSLSVMLHDVSQQKTTVLSHILNAQSDIIPNYPQPSPHLSHFIPLETAETITSHFHFITHHTLSSAQN